jgi:thymidylate kinase
MLIEMFPKEFVIINGEKHEEDVTKEIIQQVETI